MIEELTWDSELFKRRIGVVKDIPESGTGISDILENAKEQGFRYLLCRLETQRTSLIKLLESLGFYLSDIGVTLVYDAAGAPEGEGTAKVSEGQPVSVAGLGDIPALRKMATALFLESRFYSDPFFTREEADRTFQEWVENSVRGKVADVVLMVGGKGFISCRMSEVGWGSIGLLGVAEEHRGRGVGKLLVREAIRWFRSRGAVSVRVRSPLRNIRPINFYIMNGFSLGGYDILLAKEL